MKKHLPSIAFGLVLGLTGAYLVNYQIDSLDFSKIFLSTGLLLIGFVLFFFIHIIIHEFGHFLFGRVAGYQLVSFRIWSWTWIWTKSGVRFTRFFIPGTGGQCLMKPPPYREENIAFVLYLMGGSALNLLCALLALVPIWLLPVAPAWLVLFCVLGFLTCIMNIMPLQVGGIPNDGKTMQICLKDKVARKAFYLSLFVNAQISHGVRMRDFSENDFIVPENKNLADPIYTPLVFYQYSRYLDLMDFDHAREQLEKLEAIQDQLIPIYQYELACEQLFLKSAVEKDKASAKRLYQQTYRYLKQFHFLMDKQRILMAYAIYVLENLQLAQKYDQQLRKLEKSFPFPGQAATEIMLADWLKSELKASK